MPRYNPFRPGSLVTTGMFCGRIDELNTLERCLFQTKNKNPQHFLLHGERGIGKSSLLFYFQGVADGSIPPLEGPNFRFLTVSVELEPSATYQDIIRKLGADLKRTVAKHRTVEEMAKATWDFLKCWEIMGVKFAAKETEPSAYDLLDELVSTVEKTLTAFGSDFDGIVFLIDEADKPAASANLGEFCKLFTERLSKRGQNNVMLGLAGLSGLLGKMRESHESSPRVFQIITVNPLLHEERVEVVRRCLTEAHEKNGVMTAITSDAQNWIAGFSEGYPHFIQQFGYSAFEEDTDNNITVDDVARGAFKKNGALHQLGVKYYEEQYFDKIGSDEYREVLRAMSEHADEWVAKDQIRKATRLKETTLGNALSALKNRNIILAQDGKKGVYRLPTKSFAAWIKLYTQPRTTPSSVVEPPAVPDATTSS